MKISPLANSGAGSQPAQAQSSRDVAVAKLQSLMGSSQQPQVSPPIDQNAISPENASIVRQKVTSEVAQTLTAEEPASADAVVEETPPPVVAPEPTEDLSKQHQQLLRREKALRAQQRQQEQALRQREEALKAREAELAAKAPDLSKYVSRDQLQNDPLGTLTEMGLTSDQIANIMMQQQQPQDPRLMAQIRKLESQLDRMAKANEEAQKSYESQQTAAYQAAVKQIETDAKKLIATDPTFEMVKATNSTKDIVELIKRTHQEEGYVMSVQEAAQQVEDYLIEEALKLAKLSKVQSRIAPKVAQPTAKPTQEQSPATNKQPQQMKTLTNAATSGRKLSSKERAILAFKGEKF